MEAVKEAIAGAQQNAMADKMARRKQLLLIPPAADYQVAQVTNTPIVVQEIQEQQQQPAMTQPQIRSRRDSPSPSTLVDARVQTDQQIKLPCHCENSKNNKFRYFISFHYFGFRVKNEQFILINVF